MPETGPVSIAVAGDTLITRPTDARDPSLAPFRDAVTGATLAIANLDMNLIGPADREATSSPQRWPSGSAREARLLRQLGIDVLSLANDHAVDYGARGLLATRRTLDDEGLLHAGTGADLAEARAALFVGPGSSRTLSGASPGTSSRKPSVAMIAVAVSSAPDSRATASRGDIRGRPGVSPLRYTADVTVDPKTFQALKDGTRAVDGITSRGDDELIMFGTPIRKGDQTRVTFVVDGRDRREILDEVAAARGAAEIVVLAVHSHEPANGSRQPAEFVRGFARDAVDAGASAVVVHGPHRVRGIEVYKGAAIFYSVGNFLYQSDAVEPGAANVFDAGADLFAFALASPGSYPGPTPFTADSPGSYPGTTPALDGSGMVGLMTFDEGRLTGLRVEAIPAAKGPEIVRELTELSRPYGTVLEGAGPTAAVRLANSGPIGAMWLRASGSAIGAPAFQAGQH